MLVFFRPYNLNYITHPSKVSCMTIVLVDKCYASSRHWDGFVA
ncbi:MAG: hypothetical protein ACR5K5_03965 [Wolbachia sp.]